jgi:group I intron endonuclease
MIVSGIYKIINKLNGKYYVGSAVNIDRRWSRHLYSLKKGIHHNNHLQKAWNKYTKNNFDFVIVQKLPISISKKELFIEEQKWLDISFKEKEKTYNTSFLAAGGGLPGKESWNYGKKRSEESKLKLRGISRTDEVKQKISLSLLGHNVSNECKEKISKTRIVKKLSEGKNNFMFRKHHSDESKDKIRLTKIGKCYSDETKNKMSLARMKKRFPNLLLEDNFWKFTSPEGIFVEFKNLSSFCKEKKLDKGAMSKVSQGKATHHKNWRLTNLV